MPHNYRYTEVFDYAQTIQIAVKAVFKHLQHHMNIATVAAAKQYLLLLL
jgi:hypothetical protein